MSVSAAGAADLLAARERFGLRLQRGISALVAPLWLPVLVWAMRIVMRWRIEDVGRMRGEYRRLRQRGGPLLVCANHLTLVDSAVIAWALGSPAWFLRHYAALPWNVPERTNFAASPFPRALVYLMKCVTVVRGGDRREIGRVLARLAWLVSRGDVVLMFPEGGRSRTGRVDGSSAAYGVGRLVGSIPGCRVLCLYIRGESQAGPSRAPARCERFRLRWSLIEPASAHRGMRRAGDVARQIIGELQALERAHQASMGPADSGAAQEQNQDREQEQKRASCAAASRRPGVRPSSCAPTSRSA